jgi:hypothetical protein
MKIKKLKTSNEANSIEKSECKPKKEPPSPGCFVGYSYTCGHTIPEVYNEFIKNTSVCPCCITVHKVWEKEQQANRNLDRRLKEYNYSARFEWPSADSYNVKRLWVNLQLKLLMENENADIGWWYFLTQLPSFQSFVEREDICVRCMKVESMKQLPNETCEINGAALPDNFDSGDNTWNKGQVLSNPGDGSFGLVQFGNGDFAAIGSVTISNEVIERISRAETTCILKSKVGKRSGSAGGFLHPCEDEEVKKDTISMSKCTQNHRFLSTSNGTGTALTMHYLNKEKIKKVNSIYPDLAMDRLTANSKRKRACIDRNLRMKLIGEMKSRIYFLLILVMKNMGSANELFKSFGTAVDRIKNGGKKWKSEDSLLTDFECVLLEYACGTGEMRNHQALHAHTDRNRSHPVESMMIFGKVAEEDTRQSTTIVKEMTSGRLIQPYERLVWDIKCGYDVLHSRFSVTYHLSDQSRGVSNWSYVHGP